jgi:hypothetical protein
MFWTGVAVVVGAAMVVNAVRERRRLRPFYERGDLRGEWRKRFPGVTEDELREFLQIFVDSFGLRRKASLAFSPDDSLLAIYRALYPKPGLGDQCEFEDFTISVRRRYGVDLAALWREDVTLGEVWGLVRDGASKGAIEAK